MRSTVFWDRMRNFLGPQTDVFARDHVLAGLGQRTVAQALADGEPVKDVWRAVCAEMEVPEPLR